MVNIANMEPLDILRSAAIVIALLATIFADKKGDSTIWLKADAIGCCAFGLGMYLFPNIPIEYQANVKMDFWIEFMERILGANMIRLAITYYYLRDNKDRAVTGAWLLHRVVCSLGYLMLMCGLMDQAKNSKQLTLKDQYVTFGLLGSGLWTFGHVYHLFREDNLGHIRRDGFYMDKVSRNILFHAAIVGTACIFCFIFPNYVLDVFKVKDAGILHQHMITVLHLQDFSIVIFLLMAFNFNDENDKKSAFKGMLWTVLLVVPWVCLAHYKYAMGAKDTILSHVVNGGLILNAMCAVGCFKLLPSWCRLESCPCPNFFRCN